MILKTMGKSQPMNRISIVPTESLRFLLLLVARDRMVRVDRGGRAADVGVADAGRVVRVDRRAAAAIARVLLSFTTEAAHLRGFCVSAFRKNRSF